MTFNSQIFLWKAPKKHHVSSSKSITEIAKTCYKEKNLKKFNISNHLLHSLFTAGHQLNELACAYDYFSYYRHMLLSCFSNWGATDSCYSLIEEKKMKISIIILLFLGIFSWKQKVRDYFNEFLITLFLKFIFSLRSSPTRVLSRNFNNFFLDTFLKNFMTKIKWFLRLLIIFISSFHECKFAFNLFDIILS